MTTQAKTLYPAGFVETEGCEGPRLVRSQPSREQTGVTLSQCEEKYGPVSRFPLPEKPTPTPEPTLEPSLSPFMVEEFNEQNLATFLKDNFKTGTQDQINQLMDTLSGKDTPTQKLLDKDLTISLQKSLNTWLGTQSIVFYSNYQTGMFLFLIVLLFFLIGLAIPL